MSAVTYDAVPYRSVPLPQTHPNRLAALGHLFGVAVPHPARARILEIGCGGGTNLIAMGESLPDAHLVGFDLSAVQIEQGRELARWADTQNVTLHQLDLAEASSSLGEFDYVIAHGVFSWIPRPLQDRLLALCSEVLSPNGIAYVSYNIYPGWHQRGAARDLMRYHALQFSETADQVRQSRGIVEFLAAHGGDSAQAYRTELALIQGQPDYYILHEQLEGNNLPLYFHEFVARCHEQGLQYLCETELHSMMADAFPPEVRDILLRIAPDDVVRQEQFMDFLRNRMFRQTLLVKAGVPIDRSLAPSRAEALSFSGEIRSNATASEGDSQVETFVAPSGAGVSTANPLTRAVLHRLGEVWPRTIPFAELLQESYRHIRPWAQGAPSAQEQGVLAADLLRASVLGLTEAHYIPIRCVERAGEKPLASSLTRIQAASNEPVSTLRHDWVDPEPQPRMVLALLDGSRDRAMLLAALPEIGSLQALDAMLGQFAATGLLLA